MMKFTSDSDKSIRSDFSSVTLSEDRLTTSSPPSSSLNTINSSELHASSPAAPPSSLAWGITSAAVRSATVFRWMSLGGGPRDGRHSRITRLAIVTVWMDNNNIIPIYSLAAHIDGPAHLSRRPAYGSRRRRRNTTVRAPITHHHARVEDAVSA